MTRRESRIQKAIQAIEEVEKREADKMMQAVLSKLQTPYLIEIEAAAEGNGKQTFSIYELDISKEALGDWEQCADEVSKEYNLKPKDNEQQSNHLNVRIPRTEKTER